PLPAPARDALSTARIGPAGHPGATDLQRRRSRRARRCDASRLRRLRSAMTAQRLRVFDRRRSGALLHMGSLEGGLGRGGRAFIDWLAVAGFTVWQILPVGPTGADGSPYWVRSDFAGNPAFIDQSEWPDLKSADYAAFLERSHHWLDDYALFEVLSFVH